MEIAIKNTQRLIKISPRQVGKVLRKALEYLEDSNKSGVTSNKKKNKDLSLVTCHSLLPFEVSVLFVGNRKMKALNLMYRGIDRTTDVLSFPQYDSNDLRVASNELKGPPLHPPLIKGGHRGGDPSLVTCRSLLPLGDIVINMNRAKAQAEERGISLRKEIKFLLIHGLLHLFGYDHEKNRRQAVRMKKMESELMDIVCR